MANITPDSQEEQDTAYDPQAVRMQKQAETEEALRQAESSGGAAPTNTDDVADAEASGAGFSNNFTGKQKNGKTEGKGFLKRKGPIIAIGGTLGFGGIAILLLLVPGILLFHVLANLFGTLDPSSTALTQVTKIMIMNKLGANEADATSTCVIATIGCKFKTPTNDLLKELNDNGMIALDENHDPIKLDLTSKWAAERPSYYRVSSFATASGEGLDIPANQLKSALKENPVFRLGFNKVINKVGVRAFSRFSPSFLKTMEKYGFNLIDKLNIKARVTAKGKALLSDILEKSVRGVLGAEASDAAERIVDLVKLQVGKFLTKIDHLSKGSGVILAMAVGCMAAEVPSMLTKTLGDLQTSAAVNMAAPVVTSISAIKAGDGDSDTASSLGTMLTETDSNGKSALDSAGMQYVNNQSKDTKDDPTYQSVTPAAFGDLGTQLQVANDIINNPITSTNCAILANPIGGAIEAGAINAVINGSSAADFGASTALNFIIGLGASAVINSFSGNISGMVGDMIAPGIGSLAQPTINNMAAPGETRGNVIADGAGAMVTNTEANNWGNYLTTDQVSPTSAYTKNIQAQQLADAETDRATLSPLDPSSPYTFMGSIMNQLTPYYASFTSIGGTLSMLGSLLPISLGSILKLPTANAADTSLYDGACPNTSSLQFTAEDGTTKTLAANIFCQPIPGPQGGAVPDDWNPNDTVSSMESMQTDGQNEIDPTTGVAVVTTDPIVKTAKDALSAVTSLIPGTTDSYSDWLANCSDPDNATGCSEDINSSTQTYSLYTAANEVNALLDNDTSEATAVAGTDGSSDGSSSSTSTDSTSDTSTDSSAFTTDSTDDSVADTSNAITESVASISGLVSSLHQMLRSYSAASFPIPTAIQSSLASLTGFSLWG